MDNFKLEQVDTISENVAQMVEQGHISDEAKAGVVCNYKKFYIVAKEGDNVIGVLAAYTAFAEIYVDDLWVKPEYRGRGIGRCLLKKLEDKFKGKGYNNINLVTSEFQASGFYKKCGFEQEFVRINKHNPKLTKTFFVKYFDDEVQTKGVL